MGKINYSGEPDSCNCGALPTPHSHIETDGRSHNIRPDIPMKDSQDWLDDLELRIGFLRQWLNEDRITDGKLVTNEEIKHWLGYDKQAIKAHIKQEMLALAEGLPKLILKGKFEDDMGLFGDYIELAELRKAIEKRYE